MLMLKLVAYRPLAERGWSNIIESIKHEIVLDTVVLSMNILGIVTKTISSFEQI